MAEAGTTTELRWNLRRAALVVLLSCVAIEIALFVLDYHLNYGGIGRPGAVRRLFNTAREDSLAAWFATTQTFVSALVAWLLFAIARASGGSRWERVGWFVIAVFFTYMSIDDGAKVHERMGTLFNVSMRAPKGAEPVGWSAWALSFFPSYTWQIVFLPAFSALGLFTIVFLWRQLETVTLRLLVVVAIACFVFAVGLDFFEGLGERHPWNLYTWIDDTWDLKEWAWESFKRRPYRALRHFSKSLEECTEMLGNSLLLFVFLQHLARRAPQLHVRLDGRRADA